MKHSQPKSVERREEGEKIAGVEFPSSKDGKDSREHNDAAESLPMVPDDRKLMSDFEQGTTDTPTSAKRAK